MQIKLLLTSLALAASSVSAFKPGDLFNLQIKVKPGQKYPHPEFHNKYIYVSPEPDSTVVLYVGELNGAAPVGLTKHGLRRADGKPYYNLNIRQIPPYTTGNFPINPIGQSSWGSWQAVAALRKADDARGAFYFGPEGNLQYAQSPTTPRKEDRAEFLVCNWSDGPQLFIATAPTETLTRNCAFVNIVGKTDTIPLDTSRG